MLLSLIIETHLQSCDTVNDVGELLDGGSNNLRVAVQRNCKVCGIALIVHHPDQSCLVLHTHDSFLQLTVHDNTIGNNDDVIEDDLIISVVQRSQTVRQPCDGVCLAGTCAVLD